MAIHPGDSRLPLYVKGVVLPVWRKLSPCKSVGLYLLHRDYWSNTETLWKRTLQSTTPNPPECEGKSDEEWEPGFQPEHNGILEGIVHVCPWMLKYNSRVYVEVEARYILNRTELDAYDFESNETVFSARTLLNPPPCQFEKSKCFANPPKNLKSYSPEIRQLYDKLGGPCASYPLKFEHLGPSGVLPGTAFKNRLQHTFVPATEATKCTETPDLPYVTYNFPFRFDINGGPDSITLKSNRIRRAGTYSVVKSRQEIYYDAVYGFCEDIDDVDLRCGVDWHEDELSPRIRHPGQPLQTDTGISESCLKIQSFKDCFHPDAYPWQLRRKERPKTGIYWRVKVYAINPSAIQPERKDLAELTIRKLSYFPLRMAIQHLPPPQAYVEYGLSVGPRKTADAGAITLVAQLEKMFYAPGEPVNVDIKVNNGSNRVINQINVEVVQCVRILSMNDRAWRNVICKRYITAENDEAEMPVLPATERLRLRCRLNPWPLHSQLMQKRNDKEYMHRLKHVPIEAEAFTEAMPRDPGLFYGTQQEPRYGDFPQSRFNLHRPAFSSMQGVMESIQLAKGSSNHSANLNENPATLFGGDPYDVCRCLKKVNGDNRQPRCRKEIVDQPYQHHVMIENTVAGTDLSNYHNAVQQMLSPLCAQCGKRSLKSGNPVSISYEVVVSAILLPQNLPDPLAQDAFLDECNLGSGLLNPPKGEIVGTLGPRLSLPVVFTTLEAEPERPVPVANFNVDQRLLRPPKLPVKGKVIEPSDGRGFFLAREPRKAAACSTFEQGGGPES